jgi:Zn finger protein HypA/HybF involved in hydrogenase expression
VSAEIYKNKKVKGRCPKCGSKSFTITETFEEHVLVEIVDGVHPGEILDHEAGSILGVSCQCAQCRHTWKPRGVFQIDDMILEG